MDKKVNQYEYFRKLEEYEMKIVKMAGYLTDYYIDRAIESEDFSVISSFLIDYFSGVVNSPFDVGYLFSKYKEYGLDKKVEDIDFNVDEWYKIKYEINKSNLQSNYDNTKNMSEEDYINYMINKRKNYDI